MIYRPIKSTPLLQFISCVNILWLLASSVASAKPADASLTGEDIKSLMPVLQRHDTLGITHFANDGTPDRISMVIRIAAKRETILEIFKDPANFYYVSSLFKENIVLDEHQNAMVWSWASRHKILSVTGKNRLATYPPRRVDVTIEESSVGSGTFTFLLFPDGKDHTVVLFSGFLDVNSSEWLIKFLVGNNPSMKQAMNIAIGLVVVKGIKDLAERMEKKQSNRTHRTNGKSGGVPELFSSEEMNVLTPLLKKGQLFFCDSHSGGRLKQVSVMDIVNAPEQTFLSDAATPANYARYIGAISDIEVHRQEAEKTIFSWTIGLSIFGLNSENELSRETNGVALRAISGDLAGAVWRWQTRPLSDNRTVVMYHAFADVGQASSILETTVRREPYLEHGLVLGSNIVMMKAMKKIAEGKK